METGMIGTILHPILNLLGNDIIHWSIKVFSNNESPSLYYPFQNVMLYFNSVR